MGDIIKDALCTSFNEEQLLDAIRFRKILSHVVRVCGVDVKITATGMFVVSREGTASTGCGSTLVFALEDWARHLMGEEEAS